MLQAILFVHRIWQNNIVIDINECLQFKTGWYLWLSESFPLNYFGVWTMIVTAVRIIKAIFILFRYGSRYSYQKHNDLDRGS